MQVPQSGKWSFDATVWLRSRPAACIYCVCRSLIGVSPPVNKIPFTEPARRSSSSSGRSYRIGTTRAPPDSSHFAYREWKQLVAPLPHAAAIVSQPPTVNGTVSTPKIYLRWLKSRQIYCEQTYNRGIIRSRQGPNRRGNAQHSNALRRAFHSIHCDGAVLHGQVGCHSQQGK
jgi:hypothetical protein